MYCKECGKDRKPIRELEMANTYYAELECGHSVNF